MTMHFDPDELRSILLAWTVLSIGITYSYILDLFNGVGGSLEVIVAGFVATATGFILHEMGHKFVAMSRGYSAHFRIWLWGIALTLITTITSGGGFLFGAPGAVYITPKVGYYSNGFYSLSNKMTDEAKENMIISAAGPLMNLAFALFFYVTFIFSQPYSFLEILSLLGFSLNVGLGSFNMLPFPPLDGSKIFRKNIIVGLIIALPLWAMFLLSFFA